MRKLYDTDALLRELVRAYRLSMGTEWDTDLEVRHLRNQIIRLAKICSDLQARLKAVETEQFHELPVQMDESDDECIPVTCLAEAV